MVSQTMGRAVTFGFTLLLLSHSAFAWSACLAPSCLQWTVTYDAEDNERAEWAVASPDGKLVFILANEWTASDTYFQVIAVDAVLGKVAWTTSVNAAGLRDLAVDLAVASSDHGDYDVYALGTRMSASEDSKNITLTSIDGATGTKNWERVIDYMGSGFADEAYDLEVSPSGSQIAVGGLAFYNLGGPDVWFIRLYDPDGNVIWTDQDTNERVVYGLAFSPDGSRLSATGLSGDSKMVTRVYRVTDGSAVWVAKYTGGFSTAVGTETIYSGNNVVLVGGRVSTGANHDIAIVSYEASSGSENWNTTADYDGLNDVIQPHGLVIGSGRVIVNGLNTGSTSSANLWTLAYDIADGSLEWDATYQGSAGFADVPRGIVATPNGTLVAVSGHIADSASDNGRTFVYNTTSGALVYTFGPHGDPNKLDAAWGVAVHPQSPQLYIASTEEGSTADTNVVLRDYTLSILL